MKTLSKRLTLEQGKVTKELYDPKEAISLLKSTSSAKFDESMEAHISLAIDPKYSDLKGSIIAFFRFVGDCQMNLALKMFIDEKGKELLEKNLYRNFVLHVCNLFEFGVLGPGHVFTAITRMQKFLSERNHVFTDWPQQLSHWNAHGAHEHNKSASAHSNQFAGDIFEKFEYTY